MQANTITLLASALPGIDSVNNASAFQNGLDAESDDAFRSRFRNFIASRSRATPIAVGYAISSIQQGLNYTIQENIDPSGQSLMGSFVVTVDDGSGSPSTALLATVQAAIDAVRPVGSIFSVQPPTVLTVDVSLTITVPAGTTKAPVQALVGDRNQLIHQQPANRRRPPADQACSDRLFGESDGCQCQCRAGERQRERHHRSRHRCRESRRHRGELT